MKLKLLHFLALVLTAASLVSAVEAANATNSPSVTVTNIAGRSTMATR